MLCPLCQHENRPQARFCEECGGPLIRPCPNCGTRLSASAKFCSECAHPVAEPGVQPRYTSPESYTPKHLAEKILTSRSALGASASKSRCCSPTSRGRWNCSPTATRRRPERFSTRP